MCVVFSDVGRVADDQVELAARHWREPVALQEFDLAVVRLGIVAGDLKRCVADIAGSDAPAWLFTRQRDRYGAAAGAQIDHVQGFAGQAECPFDQTFGVGPRYQAGGANAQRRRHN